MPFRPGGCAKQRRQGGRIGQVRGVKEVHSKNPLVDHDEDRPHKRVDRQWPRQGEEDRGPAPVASDGVHDSKDGLSGVAVPSGGGQAGQRVDVRLTSGW